MHLRVCQYIVGFTCHTRKSGTCIQKICCSSLTLSPLEHDCSCVIQEMSRKLRMHQVAKIHDRCNTNRSSVIFRLSNHFFALCPRRLWHLTCPSPLSNGDGFVHQAVPEFRHISFFGKMVISCEVFPVVLRYR